MKCIGILIQFSVAVNLARRPSAHGRIPGHANHDGFARHDAHDDGCNHDGFAGTTFTMIGTLSRMLIVAAATTASIACGTYRHDKTIHNVVATGWDERGAVVSLAEVIRLRWDFVGINPPHTCPRRWVERRGQVVRQGTMATPVSTVLRDRLVAYARQNGRGFVVENDGTGCRLVTLTGVVSDCPFGAKDKRVVA